MNIFEFDAYFQQLLKIGDFAASDISQNGLQVENSGKPIQKAALAVYACMQTISAAAEQGADVLFVHHGFFWNKSLLLSGSHYRRIKALLESDMALYAVHLPLDVHPVYGNNAGLAERLGLENAAPFGTWRGVKAGLYGTLPLAENGGAGFTVEQILKRLFPDGEKPCNVLPFGKNEIKTAGIISGGGAGEIGEAIALHLDLFITGEIEHITYHTALENGINVIAGGHYQTETVGVKRAAIKFEYDTGIETCFIEAPTGF